MMSTDSSANCDVRKTFLITGGGGYIGFHIGLKLVQLDKDVILFDVQFPAVKWDTHISIVDSSTINGKYTVTDISCPFGKLKFIQGK
jgi:nucleoside-diphosphate-sugar epimerase